jgi:hypothetical protein
MGTMRSFNRMERPELVDDHSLPTNAKIKHILMYTSFPHTSSLRGACLVKHKDSLLYLLQFEIILTVTELDSVNSFLISAFVAL